MNSSRFFIALLPSVEIHDYAKGIQQEFADRYDSQGVQASPPHITLLPPFDRSAEQVPVMEDSLKQFTTGREPLPVTLSGFGKFDPPPSIFINVQSQELLTLQTDLIAHLDPLEVIDPVFKNRSFKPHITVAYRDLTRENFEAAWPEFQQRSFQS